MDLARERILTNPGKSARGGDRMRRTTVNAVFEGGGVKGIALVGAIHAAETCGVDFDRVAGTSSGSIVASLIAAGYSATEIKGIIEQTPFSTLLKRNPIFNVSLIGPAVRLWLRKGLYSGDGIQVWIDNLLAARGIKYFSDLPPGKIRIVVSDITNGKLVVLPDDIANYGEDPAKLSIARAVRMSTSIPYFFDPVVLKQSFKERKGKPIKTRASYMVDGGLLSNFPLWLFEDEGLAGMAIPVIGFQIVGRPEASSHRIIGPITMFQAMFETMLSAHDERFIQRHNEIRTIKIPALGVNTTQFNLSPQLSKDLYESGLTAGEKFFHSWNRLTGTIGSTGSAGTMKVSINPNPH
jgi:NTE family protein